LRTDWLADVLEITPGALRRSISRLRAVLGSEALVTGTTGYALTCPVDAVLFCGEVAQASSASERIATLERAVGMWGGAALEEFESEDWAAEWEGLTVLYGASDETGVSLEPFRTILSACVEHADIELLSEHVADAEASSRGSARGSSIGTHRTAADRVGRRDRAFSHLRSGRGPLHADCSTRAARAHAR
jgi:hypothetical protein